MRIKMLVFFLLTCAALAYSDPVLETWSAGKEGSHPGTVKTEAQKITIDLKSLPQNAKIHSARLIVFRETINGTMAEAMTDVEIHAGAERLSLMPPWYDSFDLTKTVQAWAKDQSSPKILSVKSFPKWIKEKTLIEVCYEGKPKNIPEQVKELKVIHRAGQTFITFKEIDNRASKGSLTWGGLKSLLDSIDAEQRVRYRIYRLSSRITSSNIAQAEFLAEVKPLSCWNGSGRSVDQLIAMMRRKAMDDIDLAKKLAKTGYFRRYNPNMKEMAQVAVTRFAVEDGNPLAPGTGLYVHHPRKEGKGFYAVLTSVNGSANCKDISSSNSLESGISEQKGTGNPVLQGKPDVVVFYDYPGERMHFVQWCAPPLHNLPNQSFNWGVFVPRGYKESTIKRLSIVFHGGLQRFLKPAWPHRQDTLLISPHDSPYPSYGYGYHESLGTLRSFKQGIIRPFFANRVDAMRKWALRTYKADSGRISCGGHHSWGGTAALQYGLKRPGIIAYVLADGNADPHPAKTEYKMLQYPRNKRSMRETHRKQFDPVWGKAEWNIKTESGKTIWEETDLPSYVRANKQTVMPFFSFGAGAMHYTWPQETQLMIAYLETRNSFMAEFYWGQSPFLNIPAAPFEPRTDRPVLAGYSKSLGPKASFFAKDGQFFTGRRGYGSGGRINPKFRWYSEDIVDSEKRLEITVFSARVVYAGAVHTDIAVRNTKNFKPKAGETVAWSLTDIKRKNKIQEGTAAVDENGIIVLKDVKFSKPARLVLEIK